MEIYHIPTEKITVLYNFRKTFSIFSCFFHWKAIFPATQWRCSGHLASWNIIFLMIHIRAFWSVYERESFREACLIVSRQKKFNIIISKFPFGWRREIVKTSTRLNQLHYLLLLRFFLFEKLSLFVFATNKPHCSEIYLPSTSLFCCNSLHRIVILHS